MAQCITAIVPARNEAASIRACIASLLGQDAELEVWVADDASSDGTADVVRDCVRQDPRLHLLAVPPLPPGWTGKNHALHFATGFAGGEWLLFTDADTVHEPGSLRRSLEEAERDGLALLSLSPAQEMRAWYEKAVIPRVFRALDRLYRFDEINDASRAAAAANGQYILVRRAAYEALGGHAAVRGEILEDVALARAFKRAGCRIRFESGRGRVHTRMYRSLPALWEGWTKNLYPLYGRRTGRLLASAAWVGIADVLPAAAVLWALGSGGLKVAGAAAAWLAARHLWYAWKLHRAGERPFLALCYWPGSLIFSLLLLNSFIKYVSGHALAWKGRAYSPSVARK
jgi:glycosyltransferase involved in cell wall biosynthesis